MRLKKRQAHLGLVCTHHIYAELQLRLDTQMRVSLDVEAGVEVEVEVRPLFSRDKNSQTINVFTLEV